MKIKPRLKQVRRLSQLICLAIFLFLFRQTDYAGSDTLPWAVNILFRLDPLVLFTVTLAQKTFIMLLWPAFIIIGLTLAFGRAFCSWICPLGTLIDMSGHMITSARKNGPQLGYVKYIILTVFLISSAFSVQLIGFGDPFSLLVRGMVFSIDPVMTVLVSGFFDTIYIHGPEFLSNLTEPVYEGFKAFMLPYKQSFFYLSVVSFILLVTIFLLEWISRRFWCRNLCPLGALLALISRISIFRRIPARSCHHCGQCRTDCRMDAFSSDGRFRFEDCTLCMDCLEFCPEQITKFQFSVAPGRLPVDMHRRHWIAAGLTGLALPALIRTHAGAKMPDDRLIRPPGALDEPAFSAACVRCGECMKVCINNALQPLFLERGLDNMFTPVLVPRVGYCEFNCTLCTQVCPTDALKTLTLETKHAYVLGRAWFDKNRCLVYARGISCMVCEEHCPTHDKAIKFHDAPMTDPGGQTVILKQPYVEEALCIGCGICEHVCPVQGTSAIRVTGNDPTRPPGLF